MPGAKTTVPLAATKSEPARAEPETVVHATLTGTADAALRASGKVKSVAPESPSNCETSPIVIAGTTGSESSSTIVPVAVDVPSVALVGADNVTTNVSLLSTA